MSRAATYPCLCLYWVKEELRFARVADLYEGKVNVGVFPGSSRVVVPKVCLVVQVEVPL